MTDQTTKTPDSGNDHRAINVALIHDFAFEAMNAQIVISDALGDVLAMVGQQKLPLAVGQNLFQQLPIFVGLEGMVKEFAQAPSAQINPKGPQAEQTPPSFDMAHVDIATERGDLDHSQTFGVRIRPFTPGRVMVILTHNPQESAHLRADLQSGNAENLRQEIGKARAHQSLKMGEAEYQVVSDIAGDSIRGVLARAHIGLTGILGEVSQPQALHHHDLVHIQNNLADAIGAIDALALEAMLRSATPATVDRTETGLTDTGMAETAKAGNAKAETAKADTGARASGTATHLGRTDCTIEGLAARISDVLARKGCDVLRLNPRHCDANAATGGAAVDATVGAAALGGKVQVLLRGIDLAFGLMGQFSKKFEISVKLDSREICCRLSQPALDHSQFTSAPCFRLLRAVMIDANGDLSEQASEHAVQQVSQQASQQVSQQASQQVSEQASDQAKDQAKDQARDQGFEFRLHFTGGKH